MSDCTLEYEDRGDFSDDSEPAIEDEEDDIVNEEDDIADDGCDIFGRAPIRHKDLSMMYKKNIIERRGSDRTTSKILTQYEFSNVVGEWTRKLNEGAKAINPTNKTTSLFIAIDDVLASVRPNPRLIFTEEAKKKTVPLEIIRKITPTLHDVWYLHELIYMENHYGDFRGKTEAQARELVMSDNDQLKSINNYAI